ncbi:hypothetical protein [Sulfurivermis fontis]|uniref:hypothetical protein n=1 Tax=Sulfurivermis fontis TaxID=1972068 RepID=UPI000FD85A3C|nr:hypothetical protein [Sulfurivermis fontis]
MHRIRHFALALPGLLLALDAAAFSPVQHETVIRLGELNGVALQCGYNADMRRMKQALVDTVPKVSQLGELFEQETRKSFLRMVEKRQPCPNPAPFRSEVDGAISALHRAFAGTRP